MSSLPALSCEAMQAPSKRWMLRDDSHKPGPFSIAKSHVTRTGYAREMPNCVSHGEYLRFAQKGLERISQVSLFVQSQMETGGRLSGKAQHFSSTNCKARVSRD